jgi:hypothetical protein
MPKSVEKVEVAEIVLSGGEVLQTITEEKFRSLDLTAQSEMLIQIKKMADFFYAKLQLFEPIVRTKMDAARTDPTTVNQSAPTMGVKLHLGGGKKDMELGVKQIEDFYQEWKSLDKDSAKKCFETVHNPLKKEITKFRKIRGEDGSMERKRADMIERYYNPQPKKLEFKEA